MRSKGPSITAVEDRSSYVVNGENSSLWIFLISFLYYSSIRRCLPSAPKIEVAFAKLSYKMVHSIA